MQTAVTPHGKKTIFMRGVIGKVRYEWEATL